MNERVPLHEAKYALEVIERCPLVITRLGHMNRDFEEAVHALSGKMVEERDHEKVEFLKQQLRLLFLESEADTGDETPKGDSWKT